MTDLVSTRRAWLGSAAAGTIAATWPGCGGEPSVAIERRFVGALPERGHAIRDGALRGDRSRVREAIRCAVLIVGGGAAGAAAAWRLRRAGLRDVHMIELESATGGTSRSGSTPRSRYPMGAHYLPSPHRGFAALHVLLEDLGLVLGRDARGRAELDPTAICRAPLERHRARGRWYDGIYPADGQTPAEEQQWAKWQAHLRDLDGRRGSDGRRLFDLPVDHSSVDLRALDRISMATYLDRLGLTSPRLRFTVDYACRDDYGCPLTHTSAFAALHHSLSRGLEELHERVTLTWPEGNDALVQGMLERAELGDRLRTDTAAVRIDPDTGVVEAFDLTGERGITYAAGQVLWAAPRFLLPRVLPPGRDDGWPGTLPSHAPWLVANVEVTVTPRGIGAPLAWDNVTTDASHLGYVVANHQESLVHARRPGAVLTFYEPLSGPPQEARARLLAGSLEHWSAHVLEALEAMHPGIAHTVRRIDVCRFGHAMVRPEPGWLFGPGLAHARAPLGRVLPCAADVSGLPLFEQAFCQGVRAAERALAQLGREAPTIVTENRG